MHVFTVRSWLAWLADATTGINARIPDVQLYAGDNAPPDILHFASPFDDDRCARWEAPPKYPAIYVAPDGPLTVEPEVATHTRDGQPVPLGLRYLVHKTISREAARDADYTMQAVLLSTRAFLADDAAGRAARTLTSSANPGQAALHIRTADAASYGPWSESIGAAEAIAAFAITFHVRNYAP